MKKFLRPKTCAGMTFVELIVTISIYTILSLVISTTIVALYQNNAYSFAQSTEIENARRGLTAFTLDAKKMEVAADGAFPVAVIDEHVFGFYSNVDDDVAVEYVEYELASTTLLKHVHKPTGNPPVYDTALPDITHTLSLYVQNLNQGTSTFQYYDNTGALLDHTSPLVDVRYVKVKLIVSVDPLRSPLGFTLETSITPRNLKDNL